MKLINALIHIKLQQLFGHNALIEDVELSEEIAYFSLPVSRPIDTAMGVTMTVYGTYDGKLECSMGIESLQDQLAFLDATRLVFHKMKREQR